MKSLLDIQKNIRDLENNVKEITKSIRLINSDIQGLRDQTQNIDIDFSKIKLFAKRISFDKHPLSKLRDKKVCRIYIEMLLNIVILDSDKEVFLDRLVLIQWIQMEAKIDWSLEDLFKDCYKINIDSYYELAELIPNKYNDYFLVDALIIANLGGTANREIYEYIVGLATVLSVDKEKLITLSLVARVALCQDIKNLKKKEKNELIECSHIFNYYIKDEIIMSCIESFRKIIVQVPDKKSEKFKWKVKQGEKVNKNALVAIYSNKSTQNRVNKSATINQIRSPLSGKIFIFRDNCINYGVLSYEGDNKDAIKAWVKARRKS